MSKNKGKTGYQGERVAPYRPEREPGRTERRVKPRTKRTTQYKRSEEKATKANI